MGSKKDGGGPAFPRLKVLEGTGAFIDGAWDAFAAYGNDGMSYHDVAALAAMQGMLANGDEISDFDGLALDAHDIANAMLAERERRSEQ